MIEFTGERVIPGQVEADLWNEHFARYLLASRYAGHGRTIDIGCGAGYGTALLAQSGPATGVDISAEAIQLARSSYPNATFVQASATRIPVATGTAHLVTAFEIIEHLEDWRALLAETRRILAPGGLFLVSTPNRDYYTESRGEAGANPYHVHEFSFDEFRQELQAVFPHVRILLQNRTECFSFHAHRQPWDADVHLAGGSGDPETAHFFLAICSVEAAPPERAFVYVPRAGNVLRERELHIRRLEEELRQKDTWLAESRAEHAKLVEMHGEQLRQLEEHNKWALELDRLWRASQQRVADLQDEYNRNTTLYEQKLAELEEENIRKTEWARGLESRLTAEVQEKCRELAEAVSLLERAEATVEERTRWAQNLQQRVENLEAVVRGVQASRWIRIGRAVGVGPDVKGAE